MSDIAVLSSSELDPHAAFQQLKSVEMTIASIETADLLVEVVDRAKLAEQWLRIKNAAADVVLQASRVQLTAVRRIGQLGPEAIALLEANTNERSFAARLAELTDARFRGALDELKRPVKASWLIAQIDALHLQANYLNRGYDIGKGRPADENELAERAREAERIARQSSPSKPKSRKQIERENRQVHHENRVERWQNEARLKMLGDLLKSLYRDGDPFSVSEATDRMIDLLNEHQRLWPEDHPIGDDPRNGFRETDEMQFVREGVSAAIRHALMASVSYDDANHETVHSEILGDIHPPRFVTYMDPDAGWVRIPWSNASLVQLQEMAALRRRQAEDLAAKATSLTELATILERAQQRRPDETNCANLLRNQKRVKGSAA